MNLNKVKTINDQELIKRIREVESKFETANNIAERKIVKSQGEKLDAAKKDNAVLKKEKNNLSKKNKLLEKQYRRACSNWTNKSN